MVILAAGMGSRYGGNKQVDAFGPHGESMMEYAMYDAIQIGFRHLVLVIRADMQETLKQYFNKRLPKNIVLDFVVQDKSTFVPQYLSAERQKPWGTGHALLCCKGQVHNAFGLINADDFYGREALESMFHFLKTSNENWGIVPYQLKDVLSSHGYVSRGILSINDTGNLKSIQECTGIALQNNQILSKDFPAMPLSAETLCSMNCWAFGADIFPLADELFKDFLTHTDHTKQTEFYLPAIIEAAIKNKPDKVKVLAPGRQWFGVTFQQDSTPVKERLKAFHLQGKYPSPLWVNFVQ